MKPKLLFTLAAIFMGIVGIAIQAIPHVPLHLPPDASLSLITNIRVPASLLLAFAVLNWFARNSDASSARDAIFISNTVAFALITVGDTLVTIVDSAPEGWLFVAINLLFAIAFFVVGRANWSTVSK